MFPSPYFADRYFDIDYWPNLGMDPENLGLKYDDVISGLYLTYTSVVPGLALTSSWEVTTSTEFTIEIHP